MIMASNEVLMSKNEGDMVELTKDNIASAQMTGVMDGYTIFKFIVQ